MKASYKKALIRGGILFAMFLVRVMLSLFTMWLVAPTMIEAAAKERGHHGGIGGEWIVIIGAGVLVYFLLTLIVKRVRPP